MSDDQQRLNEWATDPDARPVSVEMSRCVYFTLTSMLQLARRHPDVPAQVASAVDQIILDFQSLMPEEIRQMSLRGNDPDHDVIIQRGEHS